MNPLSSFTGDFTDPDAVFRHLTGKSSHDILLQKAKAAWDGDFDKALSVAAGGFTRQKVDLVLAKINGALSAKHKLELTELPPDVTTGANSDKINTVLMRKDLPGLDPAVDAPRLLAQIKSLINDQRVDLYDTISELIVEGVRGAYGVYCHLSPQVVLWEAACPMAALERIAGKPYNEHKLDVARKAWGDETRIPHSFDEAMILLDHVSPSAQAKIDAVLDDINAVLYAEYGFTVPSAAWNRRALIRSMPIRTFLPNVAKGINWNTAERIFTEFIEEQGGRAVQTVITTLRRGAKEALISADPKRLKF